MINNILTINIIKKIMACKKCKNNARSVVKQIKNFIKGKKTEPKPKTECQSKRQKEQDWLKNSEKGKKLSILSKPNLIENLILLVFAWTPLAIGYITVIKFIINLF